MKNLIKSMIPKRLMPAAQRLYWGLFDDSLTADFSKKRYEKLTALKCIVSYNKYGGYCVPESSRHRPAAQKILANDIFEPDTIEFLLSNCGDGDVVHAGAYFGDFLPALAEGASPGAKIWAFEPNRENYRCAKITLEINDIENVTLIHAGLGARRENLLVKTSDENGRSLGGTSRIVARESPEAAGAEVVQMVTIDDIGVSGRRVSIIQLDVEGHEKQALSGALKTIQRCLPIIILEVLPNSALPGSQWFAENISSLGYRKVDDIHGNSVFACRS